jgi:serine/threonine-protein kinase
VLYELFTGKRAFDATTRAELRRLQEESTPTQPSDHVEGLDPAVERAILRCLERDPVDRPRSALAVAAALPGGDPLAAALAAGETPSPEMVAEAGGTGVLRPAVGLTLLAVILVGYPTVYVPLNGQALWPGHVELEQSPEALAVEARNVVRHAGLEDPPTDSWYWFAVDPDYLEWEPQQPPAPREIDDGTTFKTWPTFIRPRLRLEPPPIQFWYRESPEYLIGHSLLVTRDDPAPIVPGMATVNLAPDGRLLSFRVVPPGRDDSRGAAQEPDWMPLFELAGLDSESFNPALPVWNPLLDLDGRAAWTGAYPDQPQVPIRVEAGHYGGKPVYFEVFPPWRKGARTVELGGDESISQGGPPPFFYTVHPLVWIVGLPFALANLRRGRGDRRGALRLAFFVLCASVLGTVLTGHHAPTLSEARALMNTLARALLLSGSVWLVYLALEPHARRLWPETLISWSRVLAGRFRDPRIGRDILIGGTLPVLLTPVVLVATGLVPRWLGLGALSEIGPQPMSLDSLIGLRQAVGRFILTVGLATYMSVLFLLIIVVLRLVLRRMWIASSAFVLFFALLLVFSVGMSPAERVGWLAFVLLAFGIILFVLVRFGILVLFAMFLFDMASAVVLTTDPSSWFFGRSLLLMLVTAALAVYGFYISLGGRPLFAEGTVYER